MATPQELQDSLRNFQELYNQDGRLQEMNKSWNRAVRLSVTDIGAAMTLTVQDGGAHFAPDPAAKYHMELAADSELFCALFWGEIGPSEPYMDGRLMVKGTEDDMLRLDAITAVIWGE